MSQKLYGIEPDPSHPNPRAETLTGISSTARKILLHLNAFDKLEPSEEEQAWLDSNAAFNPNQSRTGLLLAWSRALRSYGTPLSFVSNVGFEKDLLNIHGETVEVSWSVNPGHALRRQLMIAQPEYPALKDATEYPSRLHLVNGQCKLCENVAQANDSLVSDDVPTNILIDLGSSYVLPNRYPASPLNSVWVPKNHDEPSSRVTTLAPLSDTFKLAHYPGLTRGNIPTAEQLEEVFELSDALGLLALKNHTMDGMSIPFHEHFQLLAVESLAPGHIQKIYEPTKDVRVPFIGEINSLPYAALAIKGANCKETAEMAQPIIEDLEKTGQIFTITFYQGVVLLVPRSEEALATNTRLSMGAGPNFLCLIPAIHAELANRYLIPRGGFPWDKMIAGQMKPGRPTETFPVSCSYIPLPDFTPETANNIVGSILNEKARSIWNLCSNMQDKRNDAGHAATVTYLAYQLAKIHALSETEREIVVLAAILHDTGWSKIPNIAEVFRQSLHEPELERGIRTAHQNFSVEIARALLHDYPHLEKIISIIAHHDTRELPEFVNTITACVWDADMLWRVTKRGIEAGALQSGKSSEEVAKKATNWLRINRKALHLEASLEVGRIEIVKVLENLPG